MKQGVDHIEVLIRKELMQKGGTSMRYVIVFILLLTAFGVAYSDDEIRPPFKKICSFAAKEQICDFVVGNDIAYFGCGSFYGACNVRTGRLIWGKNIPEKYFGVNVFYYNDVLYVAIGRWKISACDPKTGNELWSIPLKCYSSPILINDNKLITMLQGGIISAVDINSHKVSWSQNLIPALPDSERAKMNMREGVIFTGSGLLVHQSHKVNRLWCLDSCDGRIRWAYRFGGKDGLISFTADEEQVYLTTNKDDVIALDKDKGKLRWKVKCPTYHFKPVLIENLLVLIGNDGVLYALSREDGALRWNQTISRDLHLNVSPISVHNNTILISDERRIHAFDQTGAKLWKFDSEENLFYQPITVTRDGLLLAGSHEFFTFVMGEPPKIPESSEERKKLATRLVSHFEKLNRDEKKMLAKLGDEAFEELLPIATAYFEEVDREATENAADAKAGKKTQEFWEIYQDFPEILGKVTSRKHTDVLIKLYEKCKRDFSRNSITSILAEKGEEEKIIPLFIEILQRESKNSKRGYSKSELDFICASRDPRAVRFLIDTLNNKSADPALRNSAYVSIAGTGGEEGLKAVLENRNTTRTIPTLNEFMRISKTGLKVKNPKYIHSYSDDASARLIQIKKDKRGETWGLFLSFALGSAGDLWISKHDGKKWMTPVFTGAALKEPGTHDWLSMFAGNKKIYIDSDGDGLTDLFEKRLGLNPESKDTDGDGIPDNLDKNPLAPERALSEREQVLAAAFEGRFRFYDARPVPCIVELPGGVEPFEMTGWDWVVIAVPKGKSSPLFKVIGKGVAVAHFKSPSYDFAGNACHKGINDDFILWNEDHSEARLHLVTYYGVLDSTGFDIHVKKFGNDWVVIGARLIWVS